MRTRGFTLIELMVSIALFGLIASGAMMLVISGVRMQSHSARVDVAQSAARAGLDFMTRDLLSASAGMSSGLINLGGTLTPTISVTNSTSGPDTLDVYMADTNYNFATVYTTNVSSATNSLSVDRTSYFSANQTLLLSNLANGVRFVAGGLTADNYPSTAGTIAVASGLSGGLQGASYSPYLSYVFALRHVTYKVGTPYGAGTTGVSNMSYLMVNMNDSNGDQPLAEGVEDLQVALGFDMNSDGVITDNDNSSDEWIGNANGDDWTYPANTANMSQLKAVRITIIAISTSFENGNPVVRPRAEDHPIGTTSDTLFRRLIRTEVSVRNLNI